MRGNLRWVAVALLAVGVSVVAGCGGGNDPFIYQYVSERVAYNADGTRLAFASLGANALRYIYSISSEGSSLTLLTPSDSDTDLTDEGGKQPAWSPNGVDLCIVSRRGGVQALYLMDPTVGDTARLTRLTSNTGPGADAQPSWSRDSQKLVYVSNRRAGGDVWDIIVINRDGTLATGGLADGNNNQWPVFNADGTKVAFQSDASGNTDIWVLDLATSALTNLTAGSAARDEAPSWSADGNTIAFHSNRAGDFDIWLMDANGGNPRQLTNDARSDGYPVFSNAGTQVAFTRDREIWTIGTDGLNETQITKRY